VRHRSTFIVIVTIVLGALAPGYAETWKIDPAHSAAQFSVRHMGISTVRGNFTQLGGTIQYDSANPAASSVEVTIESASVDTRVEKRDNDLRSDKFVDSAKFPQITFKSKRVEAAGAGKLKVTGDLTLHGTTKEVVLEVDGPNGPIKDMQGNPRMGASATTTINRRDFGVSTYPAAVVGEDVAITLDVEFAQTPQAKH